VELAYIIVHWSVVVILSYACTICLRACPPNSTL